MYRHTLFTSHSSPILGCAIVFAKVHATTSRSGRSWAIQTTRVTALRCLRASVGGMSNQVSSANISSNFVSATWCELTDLHISMSVSWSEMACMLGISMNFQPVPYENNSSLPVFNFTVSRLWPSKCAFHVKSPSKAMIHILNVLTTIKSSTCAIISTPFVSRSDSLNPNTFIRHRRQSCQIIGASPCPVQ